MSNSWGLLVPVTAIVGGFAIAGVSMWFRHQRTKATLDLLKSYLDQGKQAPPEVLAAIQGAQGTQLNPTRLRGSAILLGSIGIALILSAMIEISQQGLGAAKGQIMGAIFLVCLAAAQWFRARLVERAAP